MTAALERTTLAAALLAAALTAVESTAGAPAHAAAALAAVLSVIGLARNRARWQMAPAHLVVAVLAAVLIGDLQLTGVARTGGLVAAMLLIGLAAAMTSGMPVPKLPAPGGRFAVGTVTLTEERPVRATAGQTPAPARRLALIVWYPADHDPQRARLEGEALWSEYQTAPGIPAPLRLLTAYLRKARTHAVRDAVVSGTAPCPLVVYNHGLISIAAENTLLMEELASNGYIVVSVRHVDQKAELDAANAGGGAADAADAADAARVRELNRRLTSGDLTRPERARLSREVYARSAGTAAIVERRTADSRHVLDRIEDILNRIPGWVARPPARIEHVGAVGLSLGGAVATELGKLDHRCAAVVNLDGGMYGRHTRDPIGVPYLMVYSEPNAGGNDFARDAAEAAFREVTVPGAKHMDFHDAAVVLPILRWFGLLGRVSGAEVTTLKHRHIRSFLDQALLAAPEAPENGVTRP
jgi:dienelactone hydrolase